MGDRDDGVVGRNGIFEPALEARIQHIPAVAARGVEEPAPAIGPGVIVGDTFADVGLQHAVPFAETDLGKTRVGFDGGREAAMFADDAGGVLRAAEGRGDDAGVFRRGAAKHLPQAAALLFA